MTRGVGLSRARVVALAAALADAEGADALTLTRLAAVAGVRPPSLYKHVASLDDVRSALTLRAYAAIGLALTETVRPDPADAVRALAGAWRAWAKANPGVYALAARSHVRGDPAVFAEGARVVSGVLDRVRALGVHGDDAVHAARSLRALIHGFVLLEVTDGFGLGQDVEVSFDRGVEAWIRGWRVA